MGARKKGVKLVGGITDMGRQAGANRWRLRSKSKATPISKTFAETLRKIAMPQEDTPEVDHRDSTALVA